MPTEVIVSIVGLLGVIVGAALNSLLARKRNLAEIEKLRAEADKARAEADKTRAEMGSTSGASGNSEITPELAEEFARSIANVLSRYALMEFLIRVGYPSKNRSKERNLAEVEPFLSLHRKALYAHISTLTDTAYLGGTNFEFRDLLRASIYHRSFIDSLREALEDTVNNQTNGMLRADFGNTSAEIENILLRAFEKTLSNPRLALLSSWEGEKFTQKYNL